MTSSPKGGSAEVVMVCNHRNVYPTPAPRFGELAWCHRCDRFQPVKRTITIPALPTPSTYTKSVEMTVYTNSIYLPRRTSNGGKNT